MIGMNRTMGPASLITTRKKTPKRASSSTTTISASTRENHMELHSILRIRPLRGKEKEDHVVLEKATTATGKESAMAVLHPLMHLTSPDAKGPSIGSPNFIQHGQEMEYHFDKILDTNASQESVFYAIGLSMATTAIDPLKRTATPTKHQLLVALGMPNTGKSYTTFGRARVSRHADDGLVPRILDSLFSQSKHHIAASKTFGVSVQLMHVYKDRTTDLLIEPHKATEKKTRANTVRAMVATFETSKSTSEDNEVKIDQDASTGDYVIGTSSKICRDAGEAREVIAAGISRSQGSKLVGFGKVSSKGHVVINVKPVLMVRHEVVQSGGIITVVDMAGGDKVNVSKRASSNNAMRDSIGCTSSSGAFLHCMRSIQHNQYIKAGKSSSIDHRSGEGYSSDGSEMSNVLEEGSIHKAPLSIKAVSFRQSQLTMLLQPLFAHKGITIVTIMMAAYAGHRDYPEKKSLLDEMEILQGAEIANRTIRTAETGLGGGRLLHLTTKPVKNQECSSEDDLILSEDEDQASFMSANEMDFEPLPPPVAPSAMLPSGHKYINDLPGVILPGGIQRPPPPVIVATFSPQSQQQFPLASAPSAPYDDSPSNDPISNAGNSAPVGMNPNYQFSSPVPRAVATTTIPIVHPLRASNENADAEKTKSPTRNWMASSPLKTITSAVNSTKKRGKKAFETIEKMVPERINHRVVTSKISKYEETDMSPLAMIRRIEELEEQNARLLTRNSQLDEKCEALQQANSRLEKYLRQSDKFDRRTEWTQHDEREWQQSRKKKLNAQQLIQSPLMKHIRNVETTFDINNRWTDAGKAHFSLDYPKDWTRACELDVRDRIECEPVQLPPALVVPNRISRPNNDVTSSAEKRVRDEVQQARLGHR